MKKFASLYSLSIILLLISSCSYVNKSDAPVRRAPVEYGKGTAQLPIQQQVQQNNLPMAQPTNAKYKIALLVPLSGKSAGIGKAISEAAQMAIYESGNGDYQVIPFDTGDSTEGAKVAAQTAVDSGVNIILGPVFSDKVPPVAKIASAAGLKVISFSNNKAVAGGNVYILGVITDQQVDRVIKYASDRGVKGYSAILPSNLLGKQVEETANKRIAASGGEVRKFASYASTDFQTPAKDVADFYNTNSIVPDKKGEGIIVAEGGSKAVKIAGALKQEGLGSLRLLGTGLWDNPETVANESLNGAWFANTPYEESDRFFNRFTTNFGYTPEDIAALGYDGVMLAIEIGDSNFDASQLQRSSGFRGVKGSYKFDNNGVNYRKFSVYEVKNGTAAVIDSAN